MLDEQNGICAVMYVQPPRPSAPLATIASTAAGFPAYRFPVVTVEVNVTIPGAAGQEETKEEGEDGVYFALSFTPVHGYSSRNVSISGSLHNCVNIRPSLLVSTSNTEKRPAAKTAFLIFS